MRELFDTRLNLDDKPMTPGRAGRGGARPPTCWCRPSPTASTPRCSAKAGDKLKLIANFGNGVDNIDVAAAVAARHHRHQHAGRPHRGHRRHDHGADPGGAAAARRGRHRAHQRRKTGPAGRRPGCSATASGASGSASSAWAGSARRWRGAPAPSACRSTTTTAAACAAADRGGAAARPTGRASTRCSPAWTSSRSTARTRRRPITCCRRAG